MCAPSWGDTQVPPYKNCPLIAKWYKVVPRFENVAVPGPVRLMDARSRPEKEKSYQLNIIAKLKNQLNIL